ncbi:MAG: tyrosine-type recombinase/integrase [Acidobacteria bacterium]|nr:tyrosine-type recombinase/integrase [Acidobacteriota bacterium]
MPRVKRKKPASSNAKMPRGFYLKKGTWYKRIFKPDPETGIWKLRAESTSCKEHERQQAIDYIARREEELDKSKRLRITSDPGRITMNELFDDLLAAVPHEPTRKNYEGVLKTHLRPFFGKRLAADITVDDCREFRSQRRVLGIKDTTINRDLSKVSKAFKIAIQRGKIHAMPPGGCDFHKRPETENTRRVRLPDRYYAFFRDQLHPALRCPYILGYNIGRRLREILRLQWDRVDFEEHCIYFEATKFGAGKAPLMGEMEAALREQKALRDADYPDCPYVCFWFDYRFDKNGQQILRFDAFWRQAVKALGKKMKEEGLEPIELHFHDLRRSAHYQMRKAGVDSQTRRDIMGHESTSMDDRYTMIDDEALDDARRKMEAFQKERGLLQENPATRLATLREEITLLEKLLNKNGGS